MKIDLQELVSDNLWCMRGVMEDEEETNISASGERSRRWRNRMSKEEKEKFKKTDKEMKKMKWDNMSEEKKEEKRKKMRENIAKKRAEKKKKEKEEKEKGRKDLYVDNEMEHNREYKRKKAAERSEEEADFDRIEQMLRRKKSRANRTEEEHMNDNKMARKGMQDIKEHGHLMKFMERETWYASKTEEEIWRVFFHFSFKHRKVLEDRKPEVAEAIKRKKEEEQKRLDKQQRDQDEWMQECAPPGFVWRDNDYHWAGEGPQPEETKDPGYWTADLQKMNPEVTEEDEKRWKEQEERWLREEMKEQKERERKENNAYMKKYRNMLKEKLLEPIKMPEDKEAKSEYLLLQEQNIKELEERKKMSGLFDD